MTPRWLPWCIALVALVAALLFGECRRARVLDQRANAESLLAVAEARALAAERVSVASTESATQLGARLSSAVQQSRSLKDQLDRMQRAAPKSHVESVVTHTGDAFEVPVGTAPSPAGEAQSADARPTAEADGPVLQVHTTEARLRTEHGNVAVIGETVVECVGGSCPLGWQHVDEWSVDATHLFEREVTAPILRGWGLGLGVSCLIAHGCGWGPAAMLPRRTWTVRGREVYLDGAVSLTMVGAVGGSGVAVVRF